MKKIIIASLAILGGVAHAETADSCKAQLIAVKDRYVAYAQPQSDSCKAELDKGPAERSRVRIGLNCRNTSLLQEIRNNKEAICSACDAVGANITNACNDEGLKKFIDKVEHL